MAVHYIARTYTNSKKDPYLALFKGKVGIRVNHIGTFANQYSLNKGGHHAQSKTL